MKGNRYTFIFAAIVCGVSSILLSAVSEGLKAKQMLNAELEVKKNILKAVQLKEPLHPKMKTEEITKIYETKIEELVIDAQGNVVDGKKPSDIKEEEKNIYPLYIYREGEEVLAYAFPVVGQGLWSTLYGYLALEKDVTTVRGITFYKHGETPGLGGEIEKDWFQNNFKGKTIWSVKNKELTPIKVVKGKAANLFKDEKVKYHVDGITAATLTCNGVTEMMDKWIRIYDAFFSKVRKGVR